MILEELAGKQWQRQTLNRKEEKVEGRLMFNNGLIKVEKDEERN